MVPIVNRYLQCIESSKYTSQSIFCQESVSRPHPSMLMNASPFVRSHQDLHRRSSCMMPHISISGNSLHSDEPTTTPRTIFILRVALHFLRESIKLDTTVSYQNPCHCDQQTGEASVFNAGCSCSWPGGAHAANGSRETRLGGLRLYPPLNSLYVVM